MNWTNLFGDNLQEGIILTAVFFLLLIGLIYGLCQKEKQNDKKRTTDFYRNHRNNLKT
jgi:hypothetical protein